MNKKFEAPDIEVIKFSVYENYCTMPGESDPGTDGGIIGAGGSGGLDSAD